MKQQNPIRQRVNIVWLWLLIACAAAVLTFASHAVVATASAPPTEEDFIPSETLDADTAVAFPVDI